MTEDAMRELIERLEKVAGPDREIDSAIARSLETFPTAPFQEEAPFERLRGMYWVFGKRDTPDGPKEEKWSKNPPLYTHSIDDALTLVPEGIRWLVGNAWKDKHGSCPAMASVIIAGDYGGRPASAATPAIALCIASLRARIAIADQGVKSNND